MRVVVCVRWKLALERREEKKTILERARGHFNYFSFALAFWSFPIKIWCKTARLSWSATISATRGRTTSNKLDKAKNCGAIYRHFYPQKKYSNWHSSMKILAIIKWKGKLYGLPVYRHFAYKHKTKPFIIEINLLYLYWYQDLIHEQFKMWNGAWILQSRYIAAALAYTVSNLPVAPLLPGPATWGVGSHGARSRSSLTLQPQKKQQQQQHRQKAKPKKEIFCDNYELKIRQLPPNIWSHQNNHVAAYFYPAHYLPIQNINR